jgi:hypothetical protein
MTARHTSTEPTLQIFAHRDNNKGKFQQFAARVKCVNGGLTIGSLEMGFE